MTDKYNLVSGAIAPELVKEIVESVARWRAAMPFLVAFSGEERREVVHPGDQGLAASVAMADTAAAHPAHFPASVGDPAEVKRDSQLVVDRRHRRPDRVLAPSPSGHGDCSSVRRLPNRAQALRRGQVDDVTRGRLGGGHRSAS